jgi:hypothetical protein
MGKVEGKPTLKYRGAEIIAAPDACDAALSLTSVRLLSANVPLLPLKTCDRPATCNCKYRHFDDRRRGLRRESDDASVLVPVGHQGAERRKRPGRRESDYD